MAGVGSRSTCRAFFKKFDTLAVGCQYISSLMMFLEIFQTNLSIQGVNTRRKTLLYRPVINLHVFGSVSYAGIKIFSSLPPSILNHRNDKFNFKIALCKYLITHSYSTAELQMHTRNDSHVYNL